jgi:hypothetical protein
LSGLRLEPRGCTCGRSPGLEPPAGAYVTRDERPPGREAWDLRADGGGRATALVPCDTATSERSTCAMTADSTASVARASAPRGDVLRVPKPASELRLLVETGLSSSSSRGVNMEKSASLELRPGVCDSPATKGLVELG